MAEDFIPYRTSSLKRESGSEMEKKESSECPERVEGR